MFYEDDLQLESDNRNYNEHTVEMTHDEFMIENEEGSVIDYHGRTGTLIAYKNELAIVSFGFNEDEEDEDMEEISIDELIDEMY